MIAPGSAILKTCLIAEEESGLKYLEESAESKIIIPQANRTISHVIAIIVSRVSLREMALSTVFELDKKLVSNANDSDKTIDVLAAFSNPVLRASASENELKTLSQIYVAPNKKPAKSNINVAQNKIIDIIRVSLTVTQIQNVVFHLFDHMNKGISSK